jgi:hypothetical protein
MRRMGGTLASFLVILLACGSAAAQQGQINPRIPPPPPPEEIPAPAPAPPVEATPAPPPPPATVELPAGTRIPVVLDTALSTRITKRGESAIFRTTQAIPVHDTLEIPPDTEIVATVIEARKPGGFGKPGTLKIQLTGIRLASGAEQRLVARLDSQDMKQGRISADKSGSNNVVDLAQWAVLGTLGGYQVGGGKGAGYGAAAGAAIGLVIMMARRGPDLYLEPGMPFDIVVNEPVALPGAEVQTAQQNYARTNGPGSPGYSGSSSVSQMDPQNDSRVPESRRPVLKRRPRNP